MQSEKHIIQTADLQIGTTLSFDLSDAQGNLLHKAGMPITQRLLDRLVAKKIHSVTILGESKLDKSNTRDVLLQSYPPELISSIQSSISETESRIEDFVDCIAKSDEVDSAPVIESVDSFVALARRDASAALAVVMNRAAVSQELKAKLISRATTMSLLSVATSALLNFPSEDSVDVGIVAMLHDCSLLIHPEWFASDGSLNKDSSHLLGYRNHPEESAQILREIEGMSEQVIEAVAQVHEQLDGSGYPHGYSHEQIPAMAAIVNLVDAYLSLVSPLHTQNAVLPSDATAYLCHQAGLQRFDPQMVKAFVSSLSVYPLGSTVELDDESIAVVIKSNHEKPLEPIVRLLDSTGRVSDLSIANRKIIAAVSPKGSGLRRITKTMLDDILWRDDMRYENLAS
jgi:response regulator RpfG family c-di-GMP phosphodiesterase